MELVTRGPTLPTWAVQQVDSYRGYTRRGLASQRQSLARSFSRRRPSRTAALDWISPRTC
jgi:hypothetical protein